MPVRLTPVVLAKRRLALPVVLAMLVGATGCGGGDDDPKENTALFLTLNHVEVAGELSKLPDDQLLAIGRQACRDMDKGMDAGHVVADIGQSPEPGSSRYNAYSYVAATAARELCPEHKDVFAGAGQLDGLTEDDAG